MSGCDWVIMISFHTTPVYEYIPVTERQRNEPGSCKFEAVICSISYLECKPNNLQGHLASDQKSTQYELHPKFQWKYRGLLAADVGTLMPWILLTYST